MSFHNEDEVTELVREYERLKESLQCAVCLETFTPPVKLLPCLHSFCFNCLDSLFLSSQLSPSLDASPSPSEDPEHAQPCHRCPLCRRAALESTEEAEGLEGKEKNVFSLPDNFLVHQQLERLSELEEHVEGFHLGLFSSSQALSSRPSFFEREMEESEKQKVKELKEKTRRKVKETRRCQDLILESLDQIETMEAVFVESLQKEAERIAAVFGDLIEKINKQKELVLEDLEKRTREKLDALETQKKQLESDLECVTNSCDFSLAVIDHQDPQYIVNHLSHISSHLDRLLADPSFSRGPSETHVLSLHIQEDPEELRTPADGISVHNLKSIRLIEKPSSFFQTKYTDRLSSSQHLTPNRQPKTIDFATLAQPQTVFGSRGSGPGQLSRPNGVVYCADRGEVVVCDQGNHRLLIFDLSGTFLRSISSEGSAVGELKSPSGVCLDRNNKAIVVCDQGNHRVQVFSWEGKVLRSFGKEGSALGDLKSPSGVTMDRQGNYVVADRNNSRIQVFDSQGKAKKTFGCYGDEVGFLKFPRAVCVDRHDNVVVCDSDNSRVQVFDRAGSPVLCFGSYGSNDGQFVFPFGLAVDHLDRIVVCDSYNHRLQIFDSTGAHLSSFGSLGSSPGLFSNPSSVFLEPSLGRLFVSDSHNHRLQIF